MRWIAGRAITVYTFLSSDHIHIAKEVVVHPKELILRCFAERHGSIWIAICIDLSLAAQGDTPEQAQQKLVDQIGEFLHDALAGDDRAYAESLLLRKAPMKQRLRYYWLYACSKLHLIHNNFYKLFTQILPLQPA